MAVGDPGATLVGGKVFPVRAKMLLREVERKTMGAELDLAALLSWRSKFKTLSRLLPIISIQLPRSLTRLCFLQ